MIVITCALAYPITVVVFGAKWLVALPLVYCLSVAGIIASSSIPLLGLLNAIGKSHVTLTVAALWMVATWAFVIPLMMRFELP